MTLRKHHGTCRLRSPNGLLSRPNELYGNAQTYESTSPAQCCSMSGCRAQQKPIEKWRARHREGHLCEHGAFVAA
ncbi:hypothetical protein GOP47_0022837 [Adiantum capillus-veneris]|uniref:Uncharacterized protein n=1 Tax=Adiantum capillus-veneris TaxID=13818 RepID=A0A9D4U787_ADICA|nr:hypothetical protein GOP47_0022837 [Adiantum capillus-veneris]